MKPAFKITLVLLLLIGYCHACGLGGSKNDYQPPFADGALIYRQACADCHEGAHNIAPNLRNQGLTSEKVQRLVRRGKGKMPRFPNLTGDSLNAVGDFVAELK